MKIKIYINEHCFSCQEALRYFDKKGVKVEQVNVTFDQNRFDEMMTLGGIATPLIVIRDRVFHSFDRKKIDQLLEGDYE